MLRFSANLSLLFTELPLQQRFKAAKEQGFSAVDIQFPYELSAETIRQELDALQLKLVLFNVTADDLLQGGEGLAAVPEKQQQFKQAIAETCSYARILRPNAINILPGRCFDKSRLSSYQQTFNKNLRHAIQACHATSRNSGTPVAIIRSPTQRMGDALNALRPQRLRTKAASSLLPHWLDGYSECNSCSSRVLLAHVESANCPVAYQGLKITTSLSSVSMIFSGCYK
ncbi:hypothetical protein BJAS_P1476 [Bathymodiolus japonicus methanotrophic gill symbiont]|nr:hypothetical protein BJAS_P1476 [Bathymodiolus japonicus methanotrophic gill symbiont]